MGGRWQPSGCRPVVAFGPRAAKDISLAMDGSTFDRLIRELSTARPRRRLLGLLTSVGLGGLLSSLDDESTRAKCRHGRNRGHRRKHKRKHKRKRKDKDKDKGNGGNGGGNGGGSGDPCGPANCIGCCNGTTCVSAFDQSNQNCGFGGITCATCPQAFFCQAGSCVCIQPGDACDPTVQPDQCCAFASLICNNGTAQTPGVCCLEDGLPCQSTANTLCIPGSGCCCSGVCGAGNTCTPSASAPSVAG